MAERILFGGLALLLGYVSLIMTGPAVWRLYGEESRNVFAGSLPVLATSSGIGVGPMALALKAIGHSAGSPCLAPGLVPAVWRSVQVWQADGALVPRKVELA